MTMWKQCHIVKDVAGSDEPAHNYCLNPVVSMNMLSNWLPTSVCISYVLAWDCFLRSCVSGHQRSPSFLPFLWSPQTAEKRYVSRGLYSRLSSPATCCLLVVWCWVRMYSGLYAGYHCLGLIAWTALIYSNFNVIFQNMDSHFKHVGRAFVSIIIIKIFWVCCPCCCVLHMKSFSSFS